ncbi:unnamed protein product [Calypogeia fissa]
MLVRNLVRRHVCSRYGAIARQGPSHAREAALEVEGGTLCNGVDGVLLRISIVKKRGGGPSLLRSGLKQDLFSARTPYSTTTPSSPKSTTSDVAQEENSYQSSRESKFKRYFPRLPYSANIHGEAERVAEDLSQPRSSSRQRVYYAAGTGAAAMVMLVGAVAAVRYEEGSPTRAHEVLLSTWSILWDTLAEFKDKMVILLRDSVGDVVEAAAAATMLARCLISVLLTVGEEPTVGLSSWLMPGVAALVADLAAHENRRKAVVDAGEGCVVDWLLRAVGILDPGVCRATQAEASRALAHLLSDENTCEAVLSRPHALPYLFRFASSLHVKQGFQDRSKEVHLDGGTSIGRSMLVTAIVDLITSSCDAEDGSGVKPMLPGNADPADIEAALQVVKDGGWLLDEQGRNDGESAGKAANDKGGAHGIGIRVKGGTSIIGIQRILSRGLLGNLYGDISLDGLTQPLSGMRTNESCVTREQTHASLLHNNISPRQDWVAQRTVFSEYSLKNFGLWDDLQGQHITVPLAAWALAMWARASNANRAKIAELDHNGEALLVAVLAHEKTVKWHGALAMRSLLASKTFSLTADVASRWSSALLSVAAQAGKLKDPSLTHCALAALTSCVSRSKSAHSLVLQEGLPIMREIAGESEGNTLVQGALAQVLDVLIDGGELLPSDESKKWAAILLKWVCNLTSDTVTRACGSRVLDRVVNDLELRGIPITQAWLAMLLMEVISDGRLESGKGKRPANLITEEKKREKLQNQAIQAAIVAAAQLAKVVAQEAAYRADTSDTDVKVAESAAELPMIDLLGLDVMGNTSKRASKEALPKVTATEAAVAVQNAIKALTELTAEDPVWRQRILEAGVMCLLKRFLLCNDYEQWAASEASEISSSIPKVEKSERGVPSKKLESESDITLTVCPLIRKYAARLLAVLSLQSGASELIAEDKALVTWLEECAEGKSTGSSDREIRSYALASLQNVSLARTDKKSLTDGNGKSRVRIGEDSANSFWPRYEDGIFLLSTGSRKFRAKDEKTNEEEWKEATHSGTGSLQTSQSTDGLPNSSMEEIEQSAKEMLKNEPVMDVIFVHGLRGGPFKTWRVADSKASTTTPLVERIDVDAGKEGTCWPAEWLGSDLPRCRLLSVKYKTNLSEWSGATLPLQEVSSMLLDKLLAAGVGERPLVFVTHSMGGLVVKQMLSLAGRDKTRAHLLSHTNGIVFYSCPHFGSKLADMPWRMGYVLRPAPSIGELRSGSPRLEELNRYVRHLHKEGHLDILSFSETKVTPLVEGYGGWGLRLEVVPIESAYPGFGELVVLPGTDHVNSCKPLDRGDPVYTKTLEFLQNLELHAVGVSQQD